MPSSHFKEERDHHFADQALALGRRVGLTQREVAAPLGVSDKTIGRWEAGLTYPGAKHLQPIIALALECSAFAAGREVEETAVLWESACAKPPRRPMHFDLQWFASLGSAGGATVPQAVLATERR
jgi:DNA-binding XRE family transcriptional regulator